MSVRSSGATMTNDDYIFEVHKTGSFSKAAQNLFLSQPALSTAIRKTEKQLGYNIFNRKTSPLSLTEEGEVYIRALEQIHIIEQERDARIDEIRHCSNGHIHIGGTNFFVSYMLPPIMEQFVDSYPGITFEITEEDSINIYKDALQDRLNLILDSGKYNKDYFSAQKLFEEQILLAVPKAFLRQHGIHLAGYSLDDIKNGQHLSNAKSIDLSLLRTDKLILLNEGHDLCMRATAICHHLGLETSNVLRVNQLVTAYKMAQHSLGITFVSDSLAILAGADDSMAFFSLDDDLSHRSCFYAYPKNSIATASIRKFIDVSRIVCRRLFPEIPDSVQ